MSLGSVGCQDHAIVERGIEFLLSSVRADSSWSNTLNHAVSNSALALNSLTSERENETRKSTEHFESHRDFAASRGTWDDRTRASDTITEHSLGDLTGEARSHILICRTMTIALHSAKAAWTGCSLVSETSRTR